MRINLFILFTTFILGSLNCNSQVKELQTKDVDTVDSVMISNYLDSLTRSRSIINSRIKMSSKELEITKDNGLFYRLFVPTTFYHSSIGSQLAIKSNDGDKMEGAVDKALLDLYLARPDLVSATETQLNDAGTILKEDDKPKKTEVVQLVKKVTAEQDVPQQPDVQSAIVITKPNFWKFSANSKFQLQQYYYSDNWHKGGESNYSMFGELILRANYNNKQKVKFDNELVMQLGLRNSREDTLHKFKSNTDVLRYTGKLGLQATKKWYYSMELIASTQFMHGLRNNDPKVYSDFMSPFNLNLGLGMDYVVATKNNRLTGSVNVSALAFNFKYVDRKNLASRFGIKNGHRTAEDFGSKINANLTWKISDVVSWRTRLYGYTSYKRALVEWENTFKLQVSKYISANLVVYPRFDDSVKRDEDLGYFQFQEYSSLGFEYTF